MEGIAPPPSPTGITLMAADGMGKLPDAVTEVAEKVGSPILADRGGKLPIPGKWEG